jgi:DNA-binding PadR family transcriptional regulator
MALPLRDIRSSKAMKLDEIYQFFANPPVIYLSPEQAVSYVLSVLLEGESYGTELIQKLESEYPNYRLSDTVLYSALKFLEEEEAIVGNWKKMPGRGRPRRMYQLNQEWLALAQDLAQLWVNSAVKERSLLKTN